MSTRFKNGLTPGHERLHKAMIAAMTDVMRREAADMPADELLAVMAYLTGQCAAMQDQRKYTPDTVIVANLEAGTKQVLNGLADLPAAGSA